MTDEEKLKRKEAALQARAATAAVKTVGREQLSADRIAARRALAMRNMAAMNRPGMMGGESASGSISPEAVARRRLGDYQRFGAGNGVVLRTPPGQQSPQSMANVPDAPNPLDGTSLRGEVSTDSSGNRFVRGGTVQGGDLQAKLHLSSVINDPQRIDAMQNQGDTARMNRAAGAKPLTQQERNMERLNHRLAMRDAVEAKYLQHDLDIQNAQGGLKNQLTQSQINQHNAAANSSNVQSVANGGNPVPFPQPQGAQTAGPAVAPPLTGSARNAAALAIARQRMANLRRIRMNQQQVPVGPPNPTEDMNPIGSVGGF